MRLRKNPSLFVQREYHLTSLSWVLAATFGKRSDDQTYRAGLATGSRFKTNSAMRLAAEKSIFASAMTV